MSGPWIAAMAAQAALLLLLAIIVLGLLRRVASVLEAAETVLRQQAGAQPVEGLPVGARVPAFRARRAGGALVASEELHQQPGVFLFVSSDCEFCEPLLGELAGERDPLGGVRLVVVSDAQSERRSLTAGVDALVVHQDDHGVVRGARVVNHLAHLRELAELLRLADGSRPHPADPRAVRPAQGEGG